MYNQYYGAAVHLQSEYSIKQSKFHYLLSSLCCHLMDKHKTYIIQIHSVTFTFCSFAVLFFYSFMMLL